MTAPKPTALESRTQRLEEKLDCIQGLAELLTLYLQGQFNADEVTERHAMHLAQAIEELSE